MALFKIFQRGNATSDLKSNGDNKVPHHPGYAYFDHVNGKFYIDIGETAANYVAVGNNSQELVQLNAGDPLSEYKNANRICINQRVWSYNDYDVLDCGDAGDFGADASVLIFDCGDGSTDA